MKRSNTLVVDLPASINAFVEDRVLSGKFSSPGDYVRSLIEADQLRQQRDRIDHLLLKGIESGPPTPMTREDWDFIRKEGKKRLVRMKPNGQKNRKKA